MALKSYPGRFETDEKMVEVWWKLLEDLSDDDVLAAGANLCATSKFPPCIAEVRELAISISEGTLVPITPYEAWERVCEHVRRPEFRLGKLEQEALGQIGGSYRINHSQNGAEDMRHFLKAYEALQAKHRRIQMTLPAVSQTANRHAVALPSRPEETPGEERINQGTPEEIHELLKGYHPQRPTKAEEIV
jgi:hypothetical protein